MDLVFLSVFPPLLIPVYFQMQIFMTMVRHKFWAVSERFSGFYCAFSKPLLLNLDALSYSRGIEGSRSISVYCVGVGSNTGLEVIVLSTLFLPSLPRTWPGPSVIIYATSSHIAHSMEFWDPCFSSPLSGRTVWCWTGETQRQIHL